MKYFFLAIFIVLSLTFFVVAKIILSIFLVFVTLSINNSNIVLLFIFLNILFLSLVELALA